MATQTQSRPDVPASERPGSPRVEQATLDFVDLSDVSRARVARVNPLEGMVGRKFAVLEISGERDAVTIRYREVVDGKLGDAEGVMALSKRHSARIYDAARNPALGGKVLRFGVEKGKRGYSLV